MNGVRRFLGGVGAGAIGTNTITTSATTTEPPPWNAPKPITIGSSSTSVPSSSSSSSSPTKELPLTPGLLIRKDRKAPPTPTEPPVAGPSSPTKRKPPPERDVDSEWTYVGSNGASTNGSSTQGSGGVSSRRDALLMSLLSSEAVVDSRGYEIMSAEDVEDLKKEHVILTSRLTGLERKLTTELKIRDAALNLAKLNSPSTTPSPSASPKSKPNRISQKTSDEVAAANRRVDVAQREVWRIKERASDVARRLMEHRAGVLGAVVMELERKHSEDGDEEDDGGFLSPTSSVSGRTGLTAGARFEGAHLFAGHEDAVVPEPKRAKGANRKELEALQSQIGAKDEELSGLRELLQEVESEKAALQTGSARVSELEARVLALEREKAALASDKELLEMEKSAFEHERAELADAQDRVRDLEAEADGLEQERDKVQRKLERVEAAMAAESIGWVAERAVWAAERAELERDHGALRAEKERTGGDAAKWASAQAQWEQEREALQERAKDEIDKAREGLRVLVQRFDVPVYSREMTLDVLVDALSRFLEGGGGGAKQEEVDAMKEEQRKLEDLLASEMEKRIATTQQLETALEEIKVLKSKADRFSTASGSEPRLSTPLAFATDAASIVSLLQPLWATLPSPEARASKFNSSGRPFRPGTQSPLSSPVARTGSVVGSPSISNMDVRTLKELYNPAQPDSPNPAGEKGLGTFSVEAFAARVAALIADDRALIERLIRFAQAHDLLKKNAERAQKLAQDSSAALETYQKQVRMLEERSVGGSDQISVLQNDIRQHQDALERLASEKRDLETLAGEQAETVRQLTEANATLSARALALAEDAARAQEEMKTLSEREQAQGLALMEEINLVQTENGKMRTQLRALGKM
ncbi:hypothetical protein FA95DRAFT_1559169 [Auriscalpium vulgare]|uniref:Uncharacterized protein n=1 Tax=Auriscalpium vulgare TaxID=40419 RepID=A0ACB8RTL7_9AGAM|nr:hypothetical protein FA95DRAFT_1559169 [Auriscalpium vulgare]